MASEGFEEHLNQSVTKENFLKNLSKRLKRLDLCRSPSQLSERCEERRERRE